MYDSDSSYETSAWTSSGPTNHAEQTDECLQEFLLGALRLVTEIMVEDVVLAEQVRSSVMVIWRATQVRAAAARSEGARAEAHLLALLRLALRKSYVTAMQVDELLADLDLLSPLSSDPGPHHRAAA